MKANAINTKDLIGLSLNRIANFALRHFYLAMAHHNDISAEVEGRKYKQALADEKTFQTRAANYRSKAGECL